MSRTFARVVGLVLAGGRSTRFGQEKAVAQWRGAPLVSHVAGVLAEGCGLVAVNAAPGSGAAAFAAETGLPLLPDPPGVAAGPLAGVLAGLRWLERGAGDLLVTAPCDTPALPDDLVLRLCRALHPEAGAAYVRDVGRAHPLCAVWRADAAGLVEALAAGADHPPVLKALEALNAAVAPAPDAAAFANVNTLADLASLG